MKGKKKGKKKKKKISGYGIIHRFFKVKQECFLDRKKIIKKSKIFVMLVWRGEQNQ